jgi:hypothetical protein
VILGALMVAPPAFADPVLDAELAVPPMDGASIEGMIITEDDVMIDELGNTRLDLEPNAKEAEPLSAELEKRLDALSEAREAIAAAVHEEGAPLLVPDLVDPDAPPRMDSGSRDPDRLGWAEESAKADGAVAPIATDLADAPPEPLAGQGE